MSSPDPSLECLNTQFRHCVLDDKGCCLNCDRGKCGLCGSFISGITSELQHPINRICDTCVDKIHSNDKPLMERIRECERKNE